MKAGSDGSVKRGNLRMATETLTPNVRCTSHSAMEEKATKKIASEGGEYTIFESQKSVRW